MNEPVAGTPQSAILNSQSAIGGITRSRLAEAQSFIDQLDVLSVLRLRLGVAQLDQRRHGEPQPLPVLGDAAPVHGDFHHSRHGKVIEALLPPVRGRWSLPVHQRGAVLIQRKPSRLRSLTNDKPAGVVADRRAINAEGIDRDQEAELGKQSVVHLYKQRNLPNDATRSLPLEGHKPDALCSAHELGDRQRGVAGVGQASPQRRWEHRV